MHVRSRPSFAAAPDKSTAGTCSAPSGELSAFAAGHGNQAFAKLARNPMVVGDEPGPLLKGAAPVIRGQVVPKLEAAAAALGEGSPDGAALATADANLRQGWAAFMGIPPAGKPATAYVAPEPAAAQVTARSDLATQYGEVASSIVSLRAGTPKPVATKRLTRALEAVKRAGQAAASEESKPVKGPPTPGDKQKQAETDAAAVQAQITAVLAVPDTAGPADWEKLLDPLGALQNQLSAREGGDYETAGREVQWAYSAVEAHTLDKKTLGRTLGGRIKQLPPKLEAFAVEEDRLERIWKGERPIPPEWNPEIPHPPEPPPEPIYL